MRTSYLIVAVLILLVGCAPDISPTYHEPSKRFQEDLNGWLGRGTTTVRHGINFQEEDEITFWLEELTEDEKSELISVLNRIADRVKKEREP